MQPWVPEPKQRNSDVTPAPLYFLILSMINSDSRTHTHPGASHHDWVMAFGVFNVYSQFSPFKVFAKKSLLPGKFLSLSVALPCRIKKQKKSDNLKIRENQKRERTHILVVFTFVLRPAFRGRPLHSGKDGKYLHSIASIVLHSGKDWKYSEFSRLVTKLAAFMSTVYIWTESCIYFSFQIVPRFLQINCV